MLVKLSLFSAAQLRAFAKFAVEMADLEDAQPKDKIVYVTRSAVPLADFDGEAGEGDLPAELDAQIDKADANANGEVIVGEIGREVVGAAAPEKKKRRTKAEIAAANAAKDTPPDMRAIRTAADVEAAKAAGDITIYNNAGEERAAFAKSEHAADVLIKVLIAGAPDEKALTDLLTEVNKSALKRLDPADLSRVMEAYSDRCKVLTAAAAVVEDAADPTDFMSETAQSPVPGTVAATTAPPVAATTPEPSSLQALISEYGKKKGYQSFTALFKKYGAVRFSDIEQKDDAVKAAIRAEIEAALAA